MRIVDDNMTGKNALEANKPLLAGKYKEEKRICLKYLYLCSYEVRI